MNTKQTIRPLTRKQAKEALETMPLDALLGNGVSRELTSKQKKFARAVAMGETGAGAYRAAYKTKAKPKVVGDAASKLKAHAGIAQEIEALKLAQAAAEYRTPAALRALVIQTLCEVVTNPNEKGAVRVNAAKVLGTVQEVAAFRELKEVRTITSSDDTRARIMQELRSLMLNTGEAVDIEALSLLDELQSPVESQETRDYIEGDNPEALEGEDLGANDDDAAHDAAHDAARDAQFWQDSDPTPPPPPFFDPSLTR
jgi:predicted nucleic acid-binding protein